MNRLTTGAARIAVLPLAAVLLAGAGAAQAAPASSARPTTIATSARSATPAHAALPATPRCTTGALTARFRQFNAGAGQRAVTLVLTNRSRRTCNLFGYPGFGFLSSRGRALHVRVIRVPMRRSVVTLRPGWRAHACLAWEAIQGPFVNPRWVLITPPNAFRHLIKRWRGGPIGLHRIFTTAVKAGASCF